MKFKSNRGTAIWGSHVVRNSCLIMCSWNRNLNAVQTLASRVDNCGKGLLDRVHGRYRGFEIGVCLVNQRNRKRGDMPRGMGTRNQVIGSLGVSKKIPLGL